MKKAIILTLAALSLFGFVGLQGCSYAGAAISGKNAVILQNGLFGRKVFACKVEGKEIQCKAYTP